MNDKKEYQREDDVDEPLSPAHQKIHNDVKAVEERLEEHILSEPLLVEDAVVRGITTHEKQIRHLPSDYLEIIPGLTDVIYGPQLVHPDSGAPVVDGNGHPMRDASKGFQHQLGNGGIKTEDTKVQFGKGFWTAVAAMITTLGVIAVELIRHA